MMTELIILSLREVRDDLIEQARTQKGSEIVLHLSVFEFNQLLRHLHDEE